jgi:glycosyltransferase involved in cell wall biosynthesis
MEFDRDARDTLGALKLMREHNAKIDFMISANVTAVIPTIPTKHRKKTLKRALASVHQQDHPVVKTVVATDTGRLGSAATRNLGLDRVATEWVAFLDDDDEWLPHHTKTLLEKAHDSQADVIYPWFKVVSPKAFDPFPGAFRRPFKAEKLRENNYIPTTVLARTEAIRAVGGFEPYGDQEASACDDWGLWLKLLNAGATFSHAPVVTWLWHWHGKHTSGLADRW